MKLLIGLGNPGPKYEKTRHNAGFWLLDAVAARAGASWDQSTQDKFLGIIAKGTVAGYSCIFLKPMTFMNLSGKSVQKVAQFFKVSAFDWIVIHDDIDLPPGKVRAREGGGGHGGHNGLRSMMEITGRSDFHRVKLGVGRPEVLEDGQSAMDVADFLLRPMSEVEVANYIKAVSHDVDLRIEELLKRTPVT